MNICPHCKERALSAVEKLTLGPIISKRCKICGNDVGVSFFLYFLAFLPIPLFFYFASLLETPSLSLFLWLLGGGITAFVYIKLIPLIPK